MIHSRDDVIERTVREYELLDRLVQRLTAEDWLRLVSRPETKDPWTVKDTLVHIVFWKADIARQARGQRRPAEERGLGVHDHNRLVFDRFHSLPPEGVVAWHREVQADVIAALKEAPAAWFAKEHTKPWPADLDGHSRAHRTRDMERILRTPAAR